MKNTFKTLVIGFLSGLFGAYVFHYYLAEDKNNNQLQQNVVFANQNDSMPVFRENYETKTPEKVIVERDFVEASTRSTSSVVYIKTLSETSYGYSWFDWFFGDRVGQTISSGSGVIYTRDGYIITNNHVIQDADDIEVIHGKRTYKAELIGTDPSTDLAVLKINAKNLPSVTIGSSKNLKVGEWVIAVGNPFNLTSTVTAGIVSAKGREINILKSEFPIESFIQTDAAINPGNSGGALVNINGELVGINTAILSKTGSYAGYGFAVPVDIVKKVVDDMIKYGEVQKAFIGADIIDMQPEIAEQLGVNDLSGVVVSNVTNNGAADKAGLKKGDIITRVNGETVNSRSMFEERISYYSPGERVSITYKRNNKISETSLTLTNQFGTTDLIKRDIYYSENLKAELENLSEQEKDYLGIESGVKILKIQNGPFKNLRLEEGIIITHINRVPVKNAQQLEKMIFNLDGRVIITALDKSKTQRYYQYYF